MWEPDPVVRFMMTFFFPDKQSNLSQSVPQRRLISCLDLHMFSWATWNSVAKQPTEEHSSGLSPAVRFCYLLAHPLFGIHSLDQMPQLLLRLLVRIW